MYGASDLDELFRDDAVDCVKAGYPLIKGLKWIPEQVEDLSDVYQRVGSKFGITVKTSDVAAAALQNGDPITVDGKAYIVNQPVQFDDGALSVVMLDLP